MPNLPPWLRIKRKIAWELSRVAARIDPPHDPVATHLPVLIGLGTLVPIRAVLELGAGRYSTPAFLDRDVFPDVANVTSIEQDKVWVDQVLELTNGDPRLELLHDGRNTAEALDSVDLTKYDLVLVDDSVSVWERSRTIARVTKDFPAGMMIAIHDYQELSYQQSTAEGVSRFTFEASMPFTGLLWHGDRLDVSRLESIQALVRRYGFATAPQDVAGWVRLFRRTQMRGHRT